MSQFDVRSSRRHDPSLPVQEDDLALSDVGQESSAEVGNLDMTSALMNGPMDAFHGLAVGTTSLAAQGIDVSPVMTSLALRRRAMLHADIASDTSSVDRVMTRSGSALPNALRGRMEASFQHMFGHVRVHTDAAAEKAAKDLNAHAFAVGSHIYFGSGTWRPGSADTDRLLAHELTHVVQHDEGRINGSGVSSPTDPLEREAYANEDRIVGQLSELDQTPEPQSGNGWMDASLALGPVPEAVENARDGGGHAQEEAGNALNEQAASLGAGAFGMGSMVLRDEAATESPESGPKAHAVGDEVYARAGENARRGVVTEVREWAEGDGGVQVAPADGWTYVVSFERSDGTTTEDFVSENMRAAEVQSVPEASVPEASGDENAEAQVCESEEEEVEAAVETPESSVEAAQSNGPAADKPAAATSSGADSVSLPPLGPVMGPVVQSTTAVRVGQVSPMSLSSSIPESSELNATHERVVQSLNTQLGVGEGIFNTAANEVNALCIDASTSFGASETDLRTTLVSSNTQALQSLSSDVDTTLSTTSSAYDAFDQAVDQSSVELVSQLTTQAQTTETALLTSEADFPLVIQRAVEAHKIVMEGEFGAVITDITAQAAEEKTAAELEGKTYGGGAAKADAVAGKLHAAKVKENYATALRTFLDAVYEDLLSKGGMPAEEWSQSIHAPALSAVWPGMARHQQQVDEKKNRDQAAAAAGRANFENVVSLERTVVADETAAHQQDVGVAQDQTTQEINQSVQEVTEQNQSFTETVASGLQERQQDERDALASVAPDESTGVDASMWDMYVAKYEFRSNSEHELVLQELQRLNQQNMSSVQSMFDGTMSSILDYSQEEQLATQENQTVFQTNVQQTASEQVGGLQTSATEVQAQHVQTAEAAQTQSSAMLEGIGGAARTFLDTTVQPALDGYSVSTRSQMGNLLGKMEEALKSATKAGEALEKADRSKRASDVWASADYMWGTDEAKMMSAVSGTSPLQASALCEEYQHQQGHSLKYVIEDETSGSLEKSLLAWIMGDEVSAAKHAMDYGANSWFPDSDVLDPALRGVSDEGRAALAVDPEWQEKSVIDSVMNPFTDVDTMLAINSLADMSLSQDESGLRADAALLFQTMDTLAGTDEAGAFLLLEKYGPEKAAELRLAYARYSYDRMNGGGRFDALSAEDQQAHADTTLVNDINGDFSATYSEGENDRALALSQGNMGAARAGQLKDSSEWSNDPTAALAAVSDANMYQGDDWLQGVQATENHAVFMQSMAVYESGGHMDVEDMRAGTSLENRQSAIDGWDANEAATQSWITEEFSGGDTVEAMLQDKLTTGEADEGDMLMYGADTLGTREEWVAKALQQVKSQTDYYTRLDMLVNLGGRAATYQAKINAHDRAYYARQVPGQMARLPTYLAALEPSLAASLTSAIHHILICLNAEADGGTQFDWELLLGESLRRDKNAIDMWQMADQKFRNMLPEKVRTRASTNEDLQAWLDQTSASMTTDLAEQRERYENGQAESDEGQITATDVMLAGHIIKLQRMFDAGSDKHFDSATGFLFDHANADKASAAETWWSEFEAQCARVDTATAFEEASQNQLAAMATMIVTAIAGVVIAIVSFGAATAVSAALWSAGITLAAGLVNIAINFAIKGSRYGAEDMLVDLAKTLTDAALQFATLGMSRMASVGPWLKAVSAGDDVFLKLAAAAVTSLPGELNGLLFNEDVWRGDNLDMALRQFFVGIAKNSVTGVVADYGKSGFSEVTEANGLAGMYLEGAIDELTALAGDALTNPAALQDPAYWINMTTKLGIGTLGGHIAQGRAVRLMNDQAFGNLSVEHLGRLHAGALADLSEEHRTQIGLRASNGDPEFVSLQNKLLNAQAAVTQAVADTAEESVDQPLPELGTSTLVEEPGTGTTTARTDDDIDTEVLDRLIDYADGGANASMITDYVLDMETAQERLNAVNVLQEAYELQTTTHVSEMSSSDLETLVQSHMMFDAAFQESDVLRKVVSEDAMSGLWQDYHGNESRTPVVGGSVGPAENTDGLTAPETVSALGLDYRQTDPDRPSPYVTESGGRYQSVESLLYTDTPLTEDMKSSAQIPVDQSIIDFAMAHDDPVIRAFAETRYTTGQETQEAPIGGLQTSLNPFTGNGMTMPTSWLDNPTVVPNQEYTMGYTGVAPGTQWYGLDDRGNRVVVLTYNGPSDVAHAPYTRSQGIPEGSALEAQVQRILNQAYEATGQDPLRHYDR